MPDFTLWGDAEVQVLSLAAMVDGYEIVPYVETLSAIVLDEATFF